MSAIVEKCQISALNAPGTGSEYWQQVLIVVNDAVALTLNGELEGGN